MSINLGTDNAGEAFTVPVDVQTTMTAIIGRRGSGKTTTGSVLAEELIGHGLPVVILDPLGVWYGLRSTADGQGEGLPVTILGGAHGDVPLEQGAGVLIADLVVEQPGAYVIDLSGFESRAAERRFATDFAERLYRAKAKQNAALCLIVDEADTFAPQSSPRGEERLLGAFEAIARRGRVRGLGMVLITQRPAVLNKNLLTQAECLIAHQVTGPQDREALLAWAKGNASPEQIASFVATLATLKVGEAWLWSPSWLGVFERVTVRPRRTFDSSATPKAGERRVEPVVLAKVDLDALRTKMAATIEKAEADDPQKLRAEIARLTRELATFRNERKVEVQPCDHEHAIAELQERNAQLYDENVQLTSARLTIESNAEAWADKADEIASSMRRVLAMSAEIRAGGDGRLQAPIAAAPKPTPAISAPPARRTNTQVGPAPAGNARVTNPQRAILDTLATFAQLDVASLRKEHAALFAGASPKSSSFVNNLGALRTAGLIDYPRGGYVCLTAAGEQMASPGDVPATNRELQHAWFRTLKSGPQQRILEALIKEYPDDLMKVTLAEIVEASPTSSAFANNLGRLRGLGLIEYPSPGRVAATSMLFLEGEQNHES